MREYTTFLYQAVSIIIYLQPPSGGIASLALLYAAINNCALHSTRARTPHPTFYPVIVIEFIAFCDASKSRMHASLWLYVASALLFFVLPRMFPLPDSF